MAKGVAEEYSSSLADLTVNSKPLINMLTMLAEDYREHSPTIVRTVEAHLQKVPGDIKLPVLYLIDSIVKNVGKEYVSLFTQNIVSTFCSVFEQVDEKIRSQMFKLRQTWNEVFPAKKLYALDARVHSIDPAWPITAPPPHGRIHVNPKFLNPASNNTTLLNQPPTPETSTGSITTIADSAMREELLKKQKELLELQKRKVELELLQTKAILEEQQKKLENQTAGLKVETAHQPTTSSRTKSSPHNEIPEIPAPKPRSTKPEEPKPEKPKIESTRRRDPRLNSRKESADPRLNSRKENSQKSSTHYQPVNPSTVSKILPSHSTSHKEEAKPAPLDPPKKSNEKSTGSSSRHQRKRSDKSKKHKEHKPRMQVLFGDSPENKAPEKNQNSTSKSVSKHIDISIEIGESGAQNTNDDVNARVSSSVTYKRELSQPIEFNVRQRRVRKAPIQEEAPPVIPEVTEHPRENDNISQSNVIDTTTFDITEAKPVSTETEPVPMDVDEKLKDEPVQETKPVEILPKIFKIDETPIFHAPKESESVVFMGESRPNDLAVNACGDTDLRLLPPQSKSEPEQPPEKKSKADMHKLFGEEDVDLRKSLVPPPPPPPIISKSDLEFSEGWANIKRSNPERINSGKSPKKRKSLVSSPRSSIFKKKETEEVQTQDTMETDVEDRNHSLYIIMKEAEEQLKNETITYAQYNQMLKGVMSMNEESKLQEAIMKDELERIDSPESESNSSVDVQHHFEKDVPSPSAESNDSYRSHSTICEGKSGTDDNLSEQSKTSNDTTENSEKDHGSDGSRRRSRFKNHEPFHRTKSSRHNRYYNQNDPPFFVDSNKPWMARHQPPAFVHRPRKEPGYRWSFQPHRQKAEYSIITPPNRMRAPRHHPEISLPPADPAVLELINTDPMTYVNVGNSTKEVRFYGENAIIMLDWDDPRDLMFQPGSRRVFIDGADVLTLQFNAPYREITLNYGLRIRIRLGAPTRELFIDGRFYDIKFGGPPIEVNLGGQTHLIQLEGPLPFLQIGPTKRTDLVAGKVNLIVDGKIDNMFPVYLDAKPQKFEINSVPFIIRFVEALQTVVINGQPLKIQFGGIPVPIFFQGERHFLRLSSLPPGINPGYVNILNMEGGRLPTPPPPRIPPPPIINDVPPLAPPAFMSQAKPYEFQTNPQPAFLSAAPYTQYSVTSTSTSDKPVDVLTSLMPPPVPRFALQNYIVEPCQEAPVSSATTSTTAAPTVANIGTPSIDVIELYQKLVAMGVVSPLKDKEEPEDKMAIKPVDFSKPETLKLKQAGLISRLYSGIQCSSCGVRFSPEQTVKYSQHLDWHFRQNRRERNSTRIAQSRKWNYDVSDWIQYQEIEDDEDRAQSWFEIQDKRVAGEEEEETLEPTVPAKGFGENPCCIVCRDKFDQFFNEDKEEWQLKRAVCVDDKLYHPLCLKDEQESNGRNIGPVMMPVPEVEDEPIETIDLEATGDSCEEEKTNIETIDIDSSKSPEEEETSERTPIEEPEDTPQEEVPSEEKIGEEEKIPDEAEEEKMITETVDEKDENSDDDILEIEVIKPHIESYDILDDDDEEDEIAEVEKMEEDKKSDTNEEIKDNPEENDIEIRTNVVVKTEPVDLINPNTMANTSHINETIYLDGNSEITAPKILLPKKIKINISSVLSKNTDDATNNVSSLNEDTESGITFDYTEPLPPGEEVFTGRLKPRLIGNRMFEMPPVSKGKEMSGLCSIM